MLTKKIIPCLDTDKGRVVKGKRFKDIQDVDDPVDLAKFYVDAGADELVLYDITASYQERTIFLRVVEAVAAVVPIPLTVGGGIRSLEDVSSILNAGADKISINSAAIVNPDLIGQAAQAFGSKSVVLAIDAKKNASGSWNVFAKGARENTGMDAIQWALKGQELGAGEICMNSIDMDGVKEGYDLELNRILAEKLSIPIIASGGAGKMQDFADVLKVGADAALAASVFHYKEILIGDLKKFLKDRGIAVHL